MYSSARRLVGGLALLTLMAGCGPAPECDSLLAPPPQGPAGEGGATAVHIFIDATPSMLGFLSGPYYARFVDHLAPTVEDGPGPTEGRYEAFRVRRVGADTAVEPTDLLAARGPEFYAAGDTDLVAAVDSSDERALSVLVSDLFQTDSNTAELSDAIAAKYLRPGLGVGILSLPLDFDGVVYDAGGGAYPYAGRRPLYLVLLGPLDAIERYRADLSKTEDEVVGDFLLITRDLTSAPPTLSAPTDAENAVYVRGLGDGSGAPVSGLYVEVGAGEAAFDTETALSLRAGTPPLRGVEASAVDVEACRAEAEAGALSASAQASGAGLVRMRVRLAPGRTIEGRGLARYRVALSAADLGVPDWVEDRDMDLAQLQAWAASPGDFDGTKTLGLRPFVQRLLNAAMRPPGARLGEVHLAFGKD